MKRMEIGIENFKEMIEKNVYYVDKTQLIEDVLNAKVTLYTRPRRFGKTLNMSMLYYFFSNKEDSKVLFEGLNISFNKEVMLQMNQYPVIKLTFKDMKNSSMDSQIEMYSEIISKLVKNHKELFDSPALRKSDKELLNLYEYSKSNFSQLKQALFNLTNWLYLHYHKKVILLIDEYDVPLNYAFIKGYYNEMAEFISNVLSLVLKDNEFLEKGIIMGCLRVAKESIFTGLNNLRVCSLLDDEASDCFGFTQNEVDHYLEYFDMLNQRDLIKEWYDGYKIDHLRIYNSWSFLRYVQSLDLHRKKYGDQDYMPKSYWVGTSDNSVVYNFIKEADLMTRQELEILTNGKSITKMINPELTYNEIYKKENIYSLLLFTGYLKVDDYDETSNTYLLSIPNKEIKYVYTKVFNEWFYNYSKKYGEKIIDALLTDVARAQTLLEELLYNSISYFDHKESFYHGFMIGIFEDTTYDVLSNVELGDGRCDLLLVNNEYKKAIIIELKHTSDLNLLEKKAQEGVRQIIERRYMNRLEKRYDVLGYCISFAKKYCCILDVKDVQ